MLDEVSVMYPAGWTPSPALSSQPVQNSGLPLEQDTKLDQSPQLAESHDPAVSCQWDLTCLSQRSGVIDIM